MRFWEWTFFRIFFAQKMACAASRTIFYLIFVRSDSVSVLCSMAQSIFLQESLMLLLHLYHRKHWPHQIQLMRPTFQLTWQSLFQREADAAKPKAFEGWDSCCGIAERATSSPVGCCCCVCITNGGISGTTTSSAALTSSSITKVSTTTCAPPPWTTSWSSS